MLVWEQEYFPIVDERRNNKKTETAFSEQKISHQAKVEGETVWRGVISGNIYNTSISSECYTHLQMLNIVLDFYFMSMFIDLGIAFLTFMTRSFTFLS